MISILIEVMSSGKSRRKRYIDNFTNFGILIPWNDFLYILTRHFGFEMDEKTGSSARAFSKGEETFVAYEPHGKKRGDKNVSLADRKKAIRALISLGLLSEGEK